MEIAERAYRISRELPKEEQYALADQIRRCAASVPSNIAEGSKRSSKEFAHFLRVSNGSAAELETQLLLAQRMYDIAVDDTISDLLILQKMLESLLKKVASANC
jgi:four helix bundle protein